MATTTWSTGGLWGSVPQRSRRRRFEKSFGSFGMTHVDMSSILMQSQDVLKLRSSETEPLKV